MFWFQHPRPPSRKEVAGQVVARKAAPAPKVRVLIVERPVPVAAAEPEARPAATKEA